MQSNEASQNISPSGEDWDGISMMLASPNSRDFLEIVFIAGSACLVAGATTAALTWRRLSSPSVSNGSDDTDNKKRLRMGLVMAIGLAVYGLLLLVVGMIVN